MLIPLNNKRDNSLALSVIRLNKGYSVAIMSVINGYGMDSLPSYMYNERSEEVDAVVSTTDYEVVKGKDLYDCIEKCLKQLEQL